MIPAVLAVLFSFSLLETKNDDISKEKVIKDFVFHSLNQYHYQPVTLDDSFSEKAFDMYIKSLDNDKRLLLKGDVEKLRAHIHTIDEEAKGFDNPLLRESAAIMDERISDVEGFYKEILAEPFDFDLDESIETNSDTREYVATKAELKEEWRKLLKYQALVRYHAKIKAQESTAAATDSTESAPADGQTPENKPAEEQTPEEIKAKIRADILKDYNNRFDALRRRDDEDRFTTYINAIMSVYCPHTEYYPPQEKENFDLQMSGTLEGIGAQLGLVDGEIKVMSIVPGSASWRQKELKEGDIILKVGQGESEAESVAGLPLKEAVKRIRGPRGSEVRLTVRKPEGLLKTISIVRDVVVFEESYAKSAIVTDKESGRKFGIVYLPSFYADFNSSDGRSSGDDVRKELEKLKAEGVDGIVLDLRNNGGGSLQDAIKISGLFISKGPVVQVKTKDQPVTVLDDTNIAIAYDGPLAIMVNKFSASASEILAAAMQDYGRAVVIGSPTFGKGTVQRFIDLDYFLSSKMSSYKPLGSLKLTIQKFYRISGDATQVKGVTPDILLPDTYSELKVGEKDLDFVMPWDQINTVSYSKWDKASAPTDLGKLAAQSKKRIAGNEVFRLVKENALRLKEQQENNFQSLNFEKFKAEQEKLREESERFKNLSKENEAIEVLASPGDMALAETDSVKLASMKDWHTQLKKDVYIHESLSVLNDMMGQKKLAASPAER